MENVTVCYTVGYILLYLVCRHCFIWIVGLHKWLSNYKKCNSFLTTVHADLLHKWPISWCHLLMSLTMQIRQTIYGNKPLLLPIYINMSSSTQNSQKGRFYGNDWLKSIFRFIVFAYLSITVLVWLNRHTV